MVNFSPKYVCSNVERVELTAFYKAFCPVLCVFVCAEKKFLDHCNFNAKVFLSELQEIEWYKSWKQVLHNFLQKKKLLD